MLYRFAIMCAGEIAEKMAYTVSKMREELIPYAIASRGLDRAEKMAEKFGFERSYGSYEELVCDEAVDIVYVASPNSFHFEHAKLCLEHGKHVLCEKAFTVNGAQAKQLIELASRKKLFLGEAMWTRFLPGIKTLKHLLQSGQIGEVKTLNARFCCNNIDHPRLSQPELGGGALLDLGVYPIHLSSIVFATAIKSVSSCAVLTQQGVDAQNAVNITYEGGQMAVICSSMIAAMKNEAVIAGTEGFITIPDFWSCERFTVKVKDREPVEMKFPPEITGFQYEVRAMLQALEQGECCCPLLPWEETQRIMDFMDELRKTWGMRYPLEMD